LNPFLIAASLICSLNPPRKRGEKNLVISLAAVETFPRLIIVKTGEVAKQSWFESQRIERKKFKGGGKRRGGQSEDREWPLGFEGNQPKFLQN